MLSIRKLTHTYPNGVRALNNIDLEIPKGMFGLLGPNGAGKSSLMRTIATLQQPTSGSLHFGNTNILDEPMKLRQVLGYLPQEFGVYPQGSAIKILNHLAILKGITHAKERKGVVDGLLKKTNLYDERKRRLANFSGGMLQRFGIAQALIGDPKLLIVDEPTAGLDPEERNRFHNLLSEISADVVVILSTHIVEDVSVLCPNMAVMTEGSVKIQGTPAELIGELQGRVWQKVIQKSELEEHKTKYTVISNQLIVGNTVVHVNSASNPGEGFEPIQPNLEDVYFSVIAENRHSAN
ncbi:MAG: multidrug ABC transporter ATP-binding protein [SAR86 cluster bacterium]|uniref:Multidrug ABC transporter ATP-binding protein n=1 Tax=SAR86 cluster bacterium TaxID=2030880 RepID=A0A2A4X8F9_9GAMM|nr:MAG: multidrug ABC transporter ATP-binding protein [SAR86 cluster bacterium]